MKNLISIINRLFSIIILIAILVRRTSSFRPCVHNVYSRSIISKKINSFQIRQPSIQIGSSIIDSIDSLQLSIYDFQLWFSNSISTQLTSSSVNPTTSFILYLSGLLTSFSPCTISLMPLTLLFLSGGNSCSRQEKLIRSVLYCLGMSVTFSLLGLFAASFGFVFGKTDWLVDVISVVTSLLYVGMGLSLLEIVDVKFPSFLTTSTSTSKTWIDSFLFGGTSALVASPCSSPVLASLLAYISSLSSSSLDVDSSMVKGSLFLLFFSLGYCTPIVLFGTLANDVVQSSLKFKGSELVSNGFAVVLISLGWLQTLGTLKDILM